MQREVDKVTNSNNQTLHLTEDLLLAKGSERSCYLHPFDNEKVIKIAPEKKGSRNQNTLEAHYHSFLMRSNKNLEYLTHCFGFVETNLGKGLVFTRVLNYDGTASHSLSYMIYHKKVLADTLRENLNSLLSYLSANQILFSDIDCGNVFCKKVNSEEYVFIVVDGLGARRFGYKYWLYLNIGFYRRYKIVKQGLRMKKHFEKSLVKALTKDPKDIVFYK